MRATPLDVAAVIQAALCADCRERLPRLAALAGSEGFAGLCDECRDLPERVLERMRTGIHPDALAALASRIRASRRGSGKAKRRNGRAKAEIPHYLRDRKPKPRPS